MTTGADDGPTTPLQAVSDAILGIGRHREVRDVLQTIVASARTLVGARYAALGVPDGDGGFAQFVVDGVSDEEWRRIGPLPRQHGILAAMLHEPEPQRLDDVRKDPRFGWWPRAHPVLRDFLGVPIRDGDDTLGALFLANKHSSADKQSTSTGFDEHDEALLRILAAHAAIALTNARLHERSRELTIAAERGRIAHELHDAVAQKLFSLRLTAQAANAWLDKDHDRAREELAEVASIAAEPADELRAVVVELRPTALAEDGLRATLRSQTEVLDRAHAARVLLHPAGGTRDPEGSREEALLRIAQEALHNALRHAAAGLVEVALGPLPGRPPRARQVLLAVRDDGRGFDPGEVRRAGRHLGLVSMRERARAAGARLLVESAPGAGTVIEVEVAGDGGPDSRAGR